MYGDYFLNIFLTAKIIFIRKKGKVVNIGLFPKKSQEEKDLKSLNKINELKEKTKSEYLKTSIMKRRIKNSKVFSNIKDVGDDGLIELKSGEYASLIEVKAIDLSLSSKQEKINFFKYFILHFLSPLKLVLNLKILHWSMIFSVIHKYSYTVIYLCLIYQLLHLLQ